MKNILITIIILFIGISSNGQQILDEYSDIKQYIINNSQPEQLYGNYTKEIVWQEENKETSASLTIVTRTRIKYIFFFDKGLNRNSIVYKNLIVINNHKLFLKHLEYLNNNVFKQTDTTWFLVQNGTTIKITLDNNTFIYAIDK